MRRGAVERDGDEMADAHDTAHASASTHRRGIASGTCILPNCYEATQSHRRRGEESIFRVLAVFFVLDLSVNVSEICTAKFEIG